MFTSFGTAAALLLGGVAWVLARYGPRLAGKGGGGRGGAVSISGSGGGGNTAQEVILTIAVILMLLAGVEAVTVGAGHYLVGLFSGFSSLAGDVGYVIIALIAVVMILEVVVGIFKKASPKAMWWALILPFFLALFSFGILAEILARLTMPAGTVSAYLMSALGIGG